MNIKIGKVNPVATANPWVLPFQVATSKTVAAIINTKDGRSIPPVRYAWANSRTPNIITTQIRAKNKSGAAVIEPKIKPNKNSETKIDGSSLRPALLLIASFIACRSAIIKPLATQLLYALTAHQSWWCAHQ